ncbi:alkaline phosphatase family protein [Arenibacter palladensis]|uniref:alkaline phosphatase family protein n=1 Tax=Arenibacter palladensis TaxID=237373 RepID=UPI0026E15FBD|nr:alkaline phosphatase family protein [Arenibacter palladensis]MDO6603767.1 alkaline phosphatase family protein [Arenibacter palladensis]
MKKLKLITHIMVLAILSCSSNDTAKLKQDTEVNIESKKVLVIGIDGCRPDGITAANTPNLDALMANGIYSLDARNTGITSSGPGWSSMLTGVWQDKHKVVDNSFSGSDFSRYPHFFKRIEENNPNSRTVSVSQWHPINDQIANGFADITRNTADSSADVKNKAVAELGVEELTALFVHFDDVDHAGHGSGFSPDNSNYINAIETVDAAIGELIIAIKNRPNYTKEDWIIIVSTDHGGTGTSHGGDTEEERTIFMIVSGDNIPKKEIAKTTSEVEVSPANNCLNSGTELYFESNGIISVPNNVAYSFGATQDFSIECRIRGKVPADVGIIAKKDWDNGLLPGYVFSFNPGSKNFKVNLGDGTNRVDVEAGQITDNEWHTLSATFDRDGLLKVYVDGVLKNSAEMSSIGNIDNTFPFTIGGDGNGAYKYNGYISEVRVFKGLLGAQTIDAWKCKIFDDTHPMAANIKGHWKLTEGSGALITDASPTAAHGTLSGGEWRDATITTIETIGNFEHTPRTVDVVKTVLTHLCIPISPSWGLEGNLLLNSSCNDQ